MAKREIPKPTDAELSILGVLWRRGPSTVRQVRDALSSEAEMGYTTALKLMQIMHEKGLVDRDESQRTHVYRAKAPMQKTRRHLVSDLMERAFDGSVKKLVMQALGAKRVSADELAEIRALLDQIDGGHA